METKPLLVRLSPEIHAALDVYKQRTRMSKAVTVETALREMFKKQGLHLEQPAVD